MLAKSTKQYVVACGCGCGVTVVWADGVNPNLSHAVSRLQWLVQNHCWCLHAWLLTLP